MQYWTTVCPIPAVSLSPLLKCLPVTWAHSSWIYYAWQISLDIKVIICGEGPGLKTFLLQNYNSSSSKGNSCLPLIAAVWSNFYCLLFPYQSEELNFCLGFCSSRTRSFSDISLLLNWLLIFLSQNKDVSSVVWPYYLLGRNWEMVQCCYVFLTIIDVAPFLCLKGLGRLYRSTTWFLIGMFAQFVPYSKSLQNLQVGGTNRFLLNFSLISCKLHPIYFNGMIYFSSKLGVKQQLPTLSPLTGLCTTLNDQQCISLAPGTKSNHCSISNT